MYCKLQLFIKAPLVLTYYLIGIKKHYTCIQAQQAGALCADECEHAQIRDGHFWQFQGASRRVEISSKK